MRIEVNGETTQIDGSPTVAELVEALGLAGRRLAVELNREIVPKSRHAEQRLAEGDRVELVQAIGGG